MKNAPPTFSTISLETARGLMLASQGLDRPPDHPAGKQDVLAAIRSMGLLQIDTINVIARSPYLVLWSRLGDYQCEWLEELLAERALFEGWAHAYDFLPIEDYPLHRRRALDGMAAGIWPYKWPVRWPTENPAVMERVLSELRDNGEVRSADFDNATRPPGGWWNWKDEKNALEALLLTGHVMVAARRNFQRVYALRERVLPDWDDSSVPTSEEMQRDLDLRTVHALGIARQSWVADYFRQPKTGLPKRLETLANEGSLVRVQVEGLDGPAYVHPQRLGLLEEIASGRRRATLTTLLSPFDPLIWDRQRARELFNFDYIMECYTPAAKRRFGYFTLAILHRGRLVGRIDPKGAPQQGRVRGQGAVHGGRRARRRGLRRRPGRNTAPSRCLARPPGRAARPH